VRSIVRRAKPIFIIRRIEAVNPRKSMLATGLVLFGLAPLQESRREASRAAREMMATWRESAGEERWTRWQAEEAAVTKAVAQEPAQPTKFTTEDQLLWKQEEERWIAEGYRNFHSWQALGGTNGVSCDMCHPDAANTHPETYPKFQIQSKKVSLLRDMINWCIENPMKGKPLAENDPRLRSVEAYLLSTRRGVPLDPGKH
jgi:cytochrome c